MRQAEKTEKPKPNGWPKRRLSPLWPLALLILFAAVYLFPDHATTGITVWPVWIWVVVGLLLTLFAKRFRPAIAIGWLALLYVPGDLFPAALRSSTSEVGSSFRVVTLNCGGGSALVAKAIADQSPDLVLLQESPGEQELREMAIEIFGREGKVLCGPDASILARGVLEPVPVLASKGDFVAARWSPNPSNTISVVSLRLVPSAARLDFWTREYWEAFSRNSEERHGEVEQIRRELGELRLDLVGGDFNAPPYSSALRPLTAGLRDGFRDSGVGYGATAVHPTPCLVRIDQLWHGPKLRCTKAWTASTEHSDHRMVVADYAWNRK